MAISQDVDKAGHSVALAGTTAGPTVERFAAKSPVILVINSGSSSIKFAVFNAGSGQAKIFSGVLEGIGSPHSALLARNEANHVVVEEKITLNDHEMALGVLTDAIEEFAKDRFIVAAGHRVAHGGAACDCPVLITDEIEERLEQQIPLAPSHMPHNLAGISALRKSYPQLPQIACFDTAFHRTLPRIAKLTGLPRQFQEQGIERYGFHGLSYESVVAALQRSGVDLQKERIVIAHLGNGASMCALKNGRSVETTMGFSPLAGLLMGTRCGDLDPGAVLYLLTAERLTADAVQKLLNEKSGLLGVSGIASDMRDLLAQRESALAQEAIDLFCYRAKHWLGALTAVLGGLDRLVFTGGIGENAPEIRKRICEGFAYLGLAIDAKANRANEGTLSAPGADVVIQIIPADEELMIARHVRHLTDIQYSQVALS